MSFTHCHAHSAIGSHSDSMARVDELFKKASELNHPALAITDHGTMAAVFDARKASLKYGVKYIPGIEAYFVDDVKDLKQKRRHIVLLAKNHTGYKNLLTLNYEGFKNGQYVAIMNKVFPRVDWELLEKHHDGIICLTACGSGLLSRQMFIHDEDGEWMTEECDCNVLNNAKKLQSIFGENLYLEVQPHSLKLLAKNRKTGEVIYNKNNQPIVVVDQEYINKKLFEVSKKLNISMVATSDVHYIEKDHAHIHDMLMAISEKKPLTDTQRHRYEVEEFYFKDRDDVFKYFETNFDKDFAKNVCDNTLKISELCEDPKYLDTYEPRFPIFPVKDEPDYNDFLNWNGKEKNNSIPEDWAFLRYKVVQNFKKMFGHLPKEEKKIYSDRIKKEISVLEFQNFSSYFLIVADFINWANRNGIPGSGNRGSVGGSLVAYLMGIHEADPIKYNLIFERFLNKEKTEFPDIDTDFSPDGRALVEEYIVGKYGRDKVAHVSNFSRMTPKVIVKDIARSLELGGSKTDAFKLANKITDTITTDASITDLDKVMEECPEFAKYCEIYPEIYKYGKLLSGLERTYATHAGGLIISDIPLDTYVPLRIDKNKQVSIQYDKGRCEKLGLIKIDVLGIAHLDILRKTVESAKRLGMKCPQPNEISFDDPNVWRMVSEGHTMCVFQMESDHMKALCKKIKPTRIEELGIVNALGRPSSAGLRDTYIRRKHGKEKVLFKYKCLEDTLKDTMGICIYEDQLAKLANSAAGWDLNKADGLRKMTKSKEKGKELAAKLRVEFVKDTASFSNLTEVEAAEIWDVYIGPFAGYGFHTSHATFYSINGYRTAYYKYYFPAAFMAAQLDVENNTNGASKEENILLYKKEAKRLGVKILPPDINKSSRSFTAIDRNTIVAGLETIKGVGSSAVDDILKTRQQNRFKSFADFLYRTNSRFVRKDVIQALAKAGCFDELNISRKAVFDFYSDIRTKANKHASNESRIGLDPWNRLNDFKFDKNISEEWSKRELLKYEKEVLGEFVSGNITSAYAGFFTGQGSRFLNIRTMPDGAPINIEAVINSIVENKTKFNKAYIKCSLSDLDGDTIQMTVWPEQLIKYKNVLTDGRPIKAMCKVNEYNGIKSLVLNRIDGVFNEV